MPLEQQQTDAKQEWLQARLRGMGRLLVAYSGGVDSAYLAWAAYQALGEKMLAIIADSPSLARTQLADAVAFAREQSIPLEVIPTSELDRPEYVRNDAQRCFFCKDELFSLMEELRSARGFDVIAYGVNVDDQGDFRPGQKSGERTSSRRSLARCRARQRRNPNAGAPGRASHLGQARVRLLVIPH